MNKPKCSEYLYVQFLLAAQNNYTCTELSEVAPYGMAHDAATRFLAREKLTPKILWKNVQAYVSKEHGYLIADDSVIDKPHAQKLPLAKWQYSGTHHRVVKGIGVETLLWTGDFSEHIPVDFRIYDKNTDGKTKNQHFRDMVVLAKHREFNPRCILMDSWYTSVENLKTIDTLGWKWIGQLRKNRVVTREPHVFERLEEIDIPGEGLRCHLRAYGFIKVFKTASPQGDVAYYGTNDLDLTPSEVERIYRTRWKIEEYHRGLKQQCGISKCQSRLNRSQRNHIWSSIHAFVCLELHRIKHNISWQETKLSIVREAVYAYLLKPRYGFVISTA